MQITLKHYHNKKRPGAVCLTGSLVFSKGVNAIFKSLTGSIPTRNYRWYTTSDLTIKPDRCVRRVTTSITPQKMGNGSLKI